MSFGRYIPRYNVAPAQNVPAILNANPVSIDSVVWGLKPVWWKEKSRSLINIRLETLKQKPTFRRLFQKQRCLMIADGFYEWAKTGTSKQPYFISLKQKQLFAFPALWSEETDERGGRVVTCALITTNANDLIRGIHDRMPCILERTDEKRWLTEEDPERLFSILKDFPADRMKMCPVGPEVGSPAIDTPRLIEPVPIP